MPKKYLSSKSVKLFLMVGFCLILIFFNPGNIFSPIKKTFFWIAYPFQRSAYSIGSGFAEIFYFLGSISDLKKENEKLIKENNSLASQITSLTAERKENELLRQELDLMPKDKFDLETALVISQNYQKTGSWIEIDKGMADGLEIGMPVIVSDGILIGKISEVFGGKAKVNLLFDPESFVNVADLETGAKGVVRGEFGLGLVMDLVDQGEALKQGDAVATSGLGGNVPKGLLVGNIQEVRVSEDKLFQQALIVPRVKYSQIESVFVIKNNKNN